MTIGSHHHPTMVIFFVYLLPVTHYSSTFNMTSTSVIDVMGGENVETSFHFHKYFQYLQILSQIISL